MTTDDRFPIPQEWLSDELEMLVGQVTRWADKEVISRRTTLREDFEKLHVPALRSLMDDVGLQDLIWEPGDDELHRSAITLAAVLEQVGRADMGLGVLLANTWALQRQVDESLKPKLSERGALAGLVLPGYGEGDQETSAAFHGLTPQARARSQDGKWVLSGKAMRPQCHGAEAAWFGVMCDVEGTPALFAVPGSSMGVHREEMFKATGLFASRNANLALKNVELETEHLLFKNADTYRELLGWYYLGCAATASGGMLALHTILDDWAESRVIKGKNQPFKHNPLVAALLGEISGWIAPSRILVYHLARTLDRSDASTPATLALATAIARTVLRSAMDGLDRGMELMASAGYATEWNLERYWRDTKTLSTYLMLETAGQLDLARHYFGCEAL